ncbi:hypothetical protein [Priestia aryabhattai]|uniref:hypothetical protein n=1 Tax=Priestia aryabhattai TaxID=412384 RepID=UPI002452F658|nr:hypothetical protein [Priestia aryabhattai]MDH3113114.1 hypothetical protein [Priestia aryabhattai]MDH3127982.1 hypothetical protein [Priestia aryabhattai]
MKAGMIQEFLHLSKFSSLKDFNDNVEMFLSIYKKNFTKGEYIAFMRLTKYCAKVKGVANCKIQTLVSACSETCGGISRSTVERMIRKAKKLGILTVYNTTRKSGGYAHNVFVFNRFDVVIKEKLKERKQSSNANDNKPDPIEIQKETISPLETNKHNINKRYEQLDSSYTNNRVPEKFIELVRCYYDSAKTIEEYWKMAKIAAYKNCLEKEGSLILEIAIASFKQLIRKLKISKVMKPIGYFYSVAKETFSNKYYEDLFEMRYALQGVI